MISQLEGLVKALKGRAAGKVACVTVFSACSSLSEKLAQALTDGAGSVLLLLPTEGGRGSADWNAYLQGHGELVPSELKTSDGVFRLQGRCNFEFPAWATGEVARRLLEGVLAPDSTWEYAVLCVGMEHNESVLALAAATDYILFEIPEGNLEKANALCLLQAVLERNSYAEVGLVMDRLDQGETGLLAGKLFLQALGKIAKSRVRLLTAKGAAVVDEVVKLMRRTREKEGRI